jgi:glucose-6-phosphate dehydrogenase assembly protein OpcA
MNIDLTGTTSGQINAALLDARRRAGNPATGAVLTLVIVTDEEGHYDALRAATEAGREHPSRTLVVVSRRGREARLDAEIRTAGERTPGESVVMRLHGELAQHAESVVLPLLLPDAPVVTWWPGKAPDVPANDPLGQLGQRRVTDAAESENPLETLKVRAKGYTPGDTDLAWTRLTTWRTMLAATLDAPYDPITGARVVAEVGSPSAELLALWLGERLGVEIERASSDGPGITGVTLRTKGGDITMDRPDGLLATLSRPGWPDRPVALQRRGLAELIAEELRRLDPDDIYGETLQHVLDVERTLAGPDGEQSLAGLHGEQSLAEPGPGDSERADA